MKVYPLTEKLKEFKSEFSYFDLGRIVKTNEEKIQKITAVGIREEKVFSNLYKVELISRFGILDNVRVMGLSRKGSTEEIFKEGEEVLIGYLNLGQWPIIIGKCDFAGYRDIISSYPDQLKETLIELDPGAKRIFGGGGQVLYEGTDGSYNITGVSHAPGRSTTEVTFSLGGKKRKELCSLKTGSGKPIQYSSDKDLKFDARRIIQNSTYSIQEYEDLKIRVGEAIKDERFGDLLLSVGRDGVFDFGENFFLLSGRDPENKEVGDGNIFTGHDLNIETVNDLNITSKNTIEKAEAEEGEGGKIEKTGKEVKIEGSGSEGVTITGKENGGVEITGKEVKIAGIEKVVIKLGPNKVNITNSSIEIDGPKITVGGVGAMDALNKMTPCPISGVHTSTCLKTKVI